MASSTFRAPGRRSAIQSLSGSGQVNLGGQNLTITNASGTFSGTIADGGAYPVGGGSLTLAGGRSRWPVPAATPAARW